MSATEVFGYITFAGTILYMLCFAAYFMKDRLQLEKYLIQSSCSTFLRFSLLFGSIIFTILLIVDAIHLKDEMENQEL